MGVGIFPFDVLPSKMEPLLESLKKLPDFISFYFVYSFVFDLLVLVLELLIRRKFFWQIENLRKISKMAECILKVKLFHFCFSDSIPNLNR